MRREFALVLLLGAAGAGVVILALRQTWAVAVFTAPRPLPAQDISVSGQQLVPLAGALALAALACLAAVIATRSAVRRVAGALLALLGAGAEIAAIAAVRTSGVLAAARASAAADALGGSTTSGTTPGGPVHAIIIAGSGGHVVMSGLAWRPPGEGPAGRSCRRGSSVPGPRTAPHPVGPRPPGPRPTAVRPIPRRCGSPSAATWTRPIQPRSMAGHEAETVLAETVLLAEHEPEVAEMSARYLRQDGLRVHPVTDPGQVIAELTGGPDAAAVLDLTMPGLDPRRIRRALRTPVIFLVAGPRPRGLAQRGGTTGARRWLARPFSPRQLVAMVREVLAEPPAAGPPKTGPPQA